MNHGILVLYFTIGSIVLWLLELYTDERMQINFELYSNSVILSRGNSLEIRHQFSSFFLRCTTLFTVLMILQLGTSKSISILLLWNLGWILRFGGRR